MYLNPITVTIEQNKSGKHIFDDLLGKETEQCLMLPNIWNKGLLTKLLFLWHNSDIHL